MSILTQVSEKMTEILQHTADQAALDCRFVERNRKLTGSAFVQTLVFGWLENPEASYADLAETAAALDIDVSRQAIEQRMTPEAAEMLKSVLEITAANVLCPVGQSLPLLNEFTGVYVQDSTWIALPDELHSIWQGPRCRTQQQKASMKLQVRFDVHTGSFQEFHLTDGVTGDSKAEKAFQPLPAGSLRLADLGYFSLDAFEKLTALDVFWITRLKVCCHLFDEAGESLCLLKRLSKETTTVVELKCRVGATKQLPARLIALRLSQEEANKRRRNIRRHAKRRRIHPSQQRLRLAGWDIYITNVDEHHLTPEQVATLARIRWQAELMFKCFKSIGKVDTSRAKKPYRILCQIYAKLIAAVIRHWVLLASGWRCLRHDILKTATLIGKYARLLTISFHKSQTALCQTFEDLKRALQNMDRRRRKAESQTTFKRLLDAQNH